MGNSAIERAFDHLESVKASTRDKAALHAFEAVKGVRQVGESGVTGAILGAIHASMKTGLDVDAPGASVGGKSLASQKVPLDGIGMALGFVGGVFLAAEPHGVGKTLMNASAACSAVFMFRQTNDLLTKANIKKSGITPGGGAQLPNAQAAAVQPGVISKASFAGEGMSMRRTFGDGFHPASRLNVGEDPIVAAARGLP